MVETSLCGRVSCGEVASCVLLMAPQDTQAWLVSLKHPAAPEGVALCAVHADRISVPFGWALTDDREAAKPKRKRRKKTPTIAKEPPAGREPKAPERSPVPEPEPEVAPHREVTPEVEGARLAGEEPGEPMVEVGRTDEPTIQLPAVSIDHPSSPSEIPLNADGPAAAIAEASPRLSVVPGDDDPDKTFEFSDDGQGALWADRSESEQEPDESTPLLKRAFRVVRDE